VIEKLARRVIGWDVPGGLLASTYPEDAPRGPMVALADECAGSDGDIVTAAIRILGLGPVVGAQDMGRGYRALRNWGCRGAGVSIPG
jgi:tricorn protease